MKAPWLEDWRVDEDGELWINGVRPDPSDEESDIARRHLAAAAPTLAQDALLTEWAGTRYDKPQMRAWRVCPSCGGNAPESNLPYAGLHLSNCGKDAALTALGLATQAEREAARKELAEATKALEGPSEGST